MSQHTTLIALQAARRAYQAAVEACPHWSYTDPDDDGADRAHACCRELDDAQRAKKAYRAEHPEAA